jgi:hypothetical protein
MFARPPRVLFSNDLETRQKLLRKKIFEITGDANREDIEDVVIQVSGNEENFLSEFIAWSRRKNIRIHVVIDLHGTTKPPTELLWNMVTFHALEPTRMRVVANVDFIT